MLERASGSLPNYPGDPPAAAGGLGSADTRSHSGPPRKPLDFGELQQPVRRDTARFFGTMSKVPMDWAAPAIKPEPLEPQPDEYGPATSPKCAVALYAVSQ